MPGMIARGGVDFGHSARVAIVAALSLLHVPLDVDRCEKLTSGRTDFRNLQGELLLRFRNRQLAFGLAGLKKYEKLFA
jgi:hypothetical protein